MTNSDYLLKATIKKVTEKLNEIFVEKIEEATSIAQDAPETIKKEFDNLKESIIEEAKKMEIEMNQSKNSETSKSILNPKLSEVFNEIKEISEKIEQINTNMNNLT